MIYRIDRFEMKFVITSEQRARLIATFVTPSPGGENAGEGAFIRLFSFVLR